MTNKELLMNEIENNLDESKTLITIEKLDDDTDNRNYWLIDKEEVINRLDEYFDDELYSIDRGLKILRWMFIDK